MGRQKTLTPGGAGAGTAKEPVAQLIARPVIWVGSSKDDISALPSPVKASFGHSLRQVQNGETPADVKPPSTIRRRRSGVARPVRQERLSVDVCRESQTGCLCAACLHEEIEVGNRNTKARCRIDRSAPQTCACTRRRGLRKWLKSRFTEAAVTSSLISGSPPQKRRSSQRKADSFKRLTKRSSGASSHSWRPRAVAARTSPPFPRFFVVGWKA